MKVLFLRTDFYGPLFVGGSFTHTRGFLNGLEDLGHDYLAVSSGELPVDESRQVTIPYSPAYRNLPEVLSIAYNYRLLKALPDIIRRERPAFLYHRHSEFNFATSLLAEEFKIPLVLEFNGSEVWVKQQWGRSYLKTHLRLAEEVQLRRAARIAVVSEVIRDQLLSMGISPEKIVVNPNGVDPAQFSPKLNGTAVRKRLGLTGKLVACFVGTFGQWHGVEILARSIKPTVTKDPRVHFLIVGDGKLRSEVETIIQRDGVRSSVTLTGSVPHEDIPSYLAASDILLSPHVHNADGTVFFGSPTKLFEYMAAGKAIVASPVGQIGEIIRDGKNGVLMQHGDHEDLAAKILMLARNRGQRARLGRSARTDAVRKFSWKQNASRIIESVRPLLRKEQR